MTFREQLLAACKAKASLLKRKLAAAEVFEVAVGVGESVSINTETPPTLNSPRKKAPIDERAAQILNVYPRRQGGDAGLAAISKALARDGFERVLSGTSEYASAVARWSYARRVSQSGSSLIPLPATWFGNHCYLDDPKYWWEGTGKADKEEKEAVLLAEPEGWRFAHPESRNVKENIPWAAIDISTQKWIIANTAPKQKQA